MDTEVRKQVLRQLTYGLYVVTAVHGDQVAAGTINWLTQSSFEPPLVAVGLKDESGISLLAERAGRFAVNVLGTGQEQIARAFFNPAVITGETINGVAFRPGNDGMPILNQVPCAFECNVEQIVRGGDHLLLVGRVMTVHEHNQTPPLTLAATGWHYGG
jgi:flavin reductase (DIM6/NTAB) family NADH-FMN oxidoreductase RutF